MATTRDQESQESGVPTRPSRAPQVIYICVSIVLLLAAAAYMALSRWTHVPLPKGLPRGYEYQVLYALISAEVVLALYLWGVGPWSDVAAPSGVKKAPPAPRSKAAVTDGQAADGQSQGQPPAAHPPLGPRLTKALSDASVDPRAERSLQGGSR
jgi:hypothetical protein